jgi:hypothetical protein
MEHDKRPQELAERRCRPIKHDTSGHVKHQHAERSQQKHGIAILVFKTSGTCGDFGLDNNQHFGIKLLNNVLGESHEQHRPAFFFELRLNSVFELRLN